MLPAPTSPAINAATGSTATTDQRGLPMNGTPDLGAVEYQAELSGFTDADSDGMDDRLEPRYGFVVGVQDGALDQDGDGQTNAQELGNRTGPRDPNSLLKITSITRTGSDVTFTYTTFPGLSYTIETGPDLTFDGSSFTPVSPPTGFTRTNGLTISTSEPRYFFRIRRN